MAGLFAQGGDDGSEERGKAACDGAAGTGAADATRVRGLDGSAGVEDTSACGPVVGVAGANVPGESFPTWLVGVDVESGDKRGAFLFQRSLASGLGVGCPLPSRT